MKGVQQVKRAYLVFGLVLALGLLAAVTMTAGAQVPGSVTTSAQITGTGAPPTVPFSWGISANMPTYPTVNINCKVETCFEWVGVISDPFGVGNITGAFFDVRNPDGTLKIQVHMTQVTDPATIAALIASGVANGSIDAGQAAEINTQLEKLQSVIYVGSWCYDVHQYSGTFTVNTFGTDRAGVVSAPSVRNADLLAKVCLAIDFANGINFGGIIPDVEKVVRGDDNFQDGDGLPTVWNQGNTPASLQISNTDMTGATWGKKITHFDAKLLGQYVQYGSGYGIPTVTLNGPLCTCTPRQIEFSVLATSPINVDSYSGTMNITMIPFTGTNTCPPPVVN